jgi:predicted enzyme related to lactoylglutathione lyase
MARSAVGEALEPLALPDQPVLRHLSPATSTVRRHWPVALIAAGIVAMGLALPVRLQVAKSELLRLQQQFAASSSDDNATQRALDQLRGATYPGDESLMGAAATRVSQEEADLLERVDHGLAGRVVVDGKLRALKHEMRFYLRLRIGDLRAGRIVDPKTQVQLSRVTSLLTAERARFGLTGPAPPAPTVPALQFAAPGPALAIVRHWLDAPTRQSLLAVGDGLLRLDVDASRATRLSPLTPLAGELVPRQGYIAFADGTSVTAESPDWQGPPRLIGRGVEAFAASRPDAVWIVAADTVTEVDGQGHQLVPPATTIGFVASTAVGDAIAIQTQDQGLVLWDPRTKRTTCRVGSMGAPIAGGRDLMAWVGPDGGLRFTTASTCVTTTLAGSGSHLFGQYLAASGSFSPDGRTLACFVSAEGSDDPVFLVATIDLATGRVTLPTTTGLSARTLPIVWTADSRRIFYTVTTPGGADLPTTYRLGDAQVHALRFRAPPGFYVAAMISCGFSDFETVAGYPHHVAMKLELVLDCEDPDRLATFWSSALGYRRFGSAGNYRSIVPADEGSGPKLILQRVDERKSGKNRMHIDFRVPDIEVEAARLAVLGATRTSEEPIAEHSSRWIVMADPEGNEFCVCQP